MSTLLDLKISKCIITCSKYNSKTRTSDFLFAWIFTANRKGKLFFYPWLHHMPLAHCSSLELTTGPSMECMWKKTKEELTHGQFVNDTKVIVKARINFGHIEHLLNGGWCLRALREVGCKSNTSFRWGSPYHTKYVGLDLGISRQIY